MLFVTPAKARCSNGDKEYVTMFLPFVSEPNFLPIVRKTKGEHQRQLKRSHQYSIWRLSKFVNALRAMGLLFSCFPNKTEIHRYFPIAADSSQFTSTTAGSREIALSPNLPLSALIKDYFIQIWLFWPHVVKNYPVRCSTSQVYRFGCMFSLCDAVRERERQERRRSLPASCSKTCSNEGTAEQCSLKTQP